MNGPGDAVDTPVECSSSSNGSAAKKSDNDLGDANAGDGVHDPFAGADTLAPAVAGGDGGGADPFANVGYSPLALVGAHMNPDDGSDDEGGVGYSYQFVGFAQPDGCDSDDGGGGGEGSDGGVGEHGSNGTGGGGEGGNNVDGIADMLLSRLENEYAAVVAMGKKRTGDASAAASVPAPASAPPAPPTANGDKQEDGGGGGGEDEDNTSDGTQQQNSGVRASTSAPRPPAPRLSSEEVAAVRRAMGGMKLRLRPPTSARGGAGGAGGAAAVDAAVSAAAAPGKGGRYAGQVELGTAAGSDELTKIALAHLGRGVKGKRGSSSGGGGGGGDAAAPPAHQGWARW